jgi:outer membrane lipoprotein-sorting protein
MCALLGAVAVLSGAPAAFADSEATALVKKAVESLPTVPFDAKITLTTANGQRFLELKQKKAADGTRMGYLEVVGPADLAGIRHLFLEPTNGEPPQQYLKLTASRSIVRVSADTREQPFLGSTFYIADLVEPPTEGYTYEFAGDVELLGRNCKLVESTPKDPENEPYGKIVAAIDPKDNLVLRRQFFDDTGKLLKTWQVEKLVKMQGFWTPLVQDMRNVQDNAESRLEITEVTYNAQIPDEVFRPDYLKR